MHAIFRLQMQKPQDMHGYLHWSKKKEKREERKGKEGGGRDILCCLVNLVLKRGNIVGNSAKF